MYNTTTLRAVWSQTKFPCYLGQALLWEHPALRALPNLKNSQKLLCFIFPCDTHQGKKLTRGEHFKKCSLLVEIELNFVMLSPNTLNKVFRLCNFNLCSFALDILFYPRGGVQTNVGWLSRKRPIINLAINPTIDNLPINYLISFEDQVDNLFTLYISFQELTRPLWVGHWIFKF
jgi:hypothetical protein